MYQGAVQGSIVFRQYYPEGGWGCVIVLVGLIMTIITSGTQMSFCVLVKPAVWKFQPSLLSIHCLAGLSISVTFILAPLTVSVCKVRKSYQIFFSIGVELVIPRFKISFYDEMPIQRKSIRLTAVVAGLVISLGCLFTSFAREFHQVFISYGLIMSTGIAMAQNSFMLMLGQYFKKRRELVEMIVVSGTGAGIALMSSALDFTVRRFGWRLGLQAITLLLLSVFFIGMFYRSASLYHPQRRAILHLKNQTRKIKCKKEEKSKILK